MLLLVKYKLALEFRLERDLRFDMLRGAGGIVRDAVPA